MYITVPLPPKTIKHLIDCSRVFILNNYGGSLQDEVLQRVYNKIQKCFTEISVELNQEEKKAMLQKLVSEHAAGEWYGGKKKRKSRRHKKKKRKITRKKYT